MTILVSYGYDLQLVEYLFSLDQASHHAFVVFVSFEDLGEVGIFHVLHIKVGHTQHIANIDLSFKHTLERAVKCATGFFIEVTQVTVFVIVGHINQDGAEDGLIAQHVIACDIAHPFLLGDVTSCADDDGRSSVLMVTQYRQCHGIFSGVALFFPQVNGVVLYLPTDNIVDGLNHVFKVFPDI